MLYDINSSLPSALYQVTLYGHTKSTTLPLSTALHTKLIKTLCYYQSKQDNELKIITSKHGNTWVGSVFVNSGDILDSDPKLSLDPCRWAASPAALFPWLLDNSCWSCWRCFSCLSRSCWNCALDATNSAYTSLLEFVGASCCKGDYKNK